jgi:hypothetical protein
MLRVEKDTIQADYLREYKGNEAFGLQISTNNKPLQIYNAYSLIGSPIEWFRAKKILYQDAIESTHELDTDCIYYSDSQYLIDASKYFDNATPTNILPDGIYFLQFYNGSETFNSECFRVIAQLISGDYTQPEVKKFENDELFLFND